MASAPCLSPATSALVLGLSDSEDDEEEATPRDAGGGSALQDLSTTPSSDSGSGSLEARRTPPRVLKRSLRSELLERWPGWTSPARKRLRAASPDTPDLQDPVTAAALSSALAWSMTTATPSTPPTGPCDRFWKLVEKIASQPSLLDRGEDCERLCIEEAAEDCAEEAAASPARHSPRPSPRTSPRPSPPPSPRPSAPPSPGPSPPRSPHRSLNCSSRSSPAARRKPDRRDTSARTLTAPLSTWVGDDPTLLQTVVLAVPDDHDDDLESGPSRASLSPGHDGAEPATPPTAVDAIHLADGHLDGQEARRPARELLERLQLLAGQPSGGEQDKPDVEEDSSVLQLLVLTPTEERKFGEAPRRPGACLPTAAATTSKYKTALGVLLRLRIPYFIIALGIVQVTLYAAPSPYAAQEMKNRFVWDKARLFKEPWRAMSYAMLHSGQMHVGLNVGVQSFVGAPLEREQSALRVAAVFFGGAVYGALVTGVISPTLHMVGASAGIYAILMSHLAQILLNSDAVRYPKTRAGAVLLLTGADMAYTAHHAIQRGNAAPRIGVTAHCAGALSGVFLGLAFYRTSPSSLAGLARTHPSYLSYFCYCCHRRCVLSSLQVCSGIVMAAGVLFCLVWIYFDKPGEGLGLSL
ncbi:uncharacterized protein LOC117639216 [Thrips palmi]|uniref:Uncharacterized protein LOC117639216 n=1 Tax=Thrips palmi TaxID=161013 RepID=A0A6P8Y9W7_THRPL|nr:uncharacterized protein LOC117639216 [Thrips palmi]